MHCIVRVRIENIYVITWLTLEQLLYTLACYERV